jgi:hypothetical protein
LRLLIHRVFQQAICPFLDFHPKANGLSTQGFSKPALVCSGRD